MQSWAASVLYGAVDAIAGLGGLRLLTGAITAAVLVAAWVLTRSAVSLLARVVVVAPLIVIAATEWTERPYVLALGCLAVVLLAAEGTFNARWLLPVGWVWLNTHGSWPLGLVALLAIGLGSRLDAENAGRVWRALRWLLIGLAIGAVNPYGPRLWVFPFELLSRRDALRSVVEWQAPEFTSLGQLTFVATIMLAAAAFVRSGRWRACVPFLVFVPLALTGARSISFAALVVVPGTARALRGLGSVDGTRRSRVTSMAAAGVVAAGLAFVLAVPASDDFDDELYPVAADRWLRAHGYAPPAARVVTHDYVGNWWEARFLDNAGAWIDDRVEVLPQQLVDDYVVLLGGEENWRQALRRYEPDAVLWESDEPLSQLLEEDDEWRLAFDADGWTVFIRR